MESLLLLPVVIVVATSCAGLFAVALAWYRHPDTPTERQQVDGGARLVGIVIAIAGFLLLGIDDALVRAVPGATLPSIDRLFLGVFAALAVSLPVLRAPAVVRRTVSDDEPLAEVLVDVASGTVPLGLLALLSVLALIVGAKSAFPPVVALVPPVAAFAFSAVTGRVAVAQRTTLPLSAAATDAVERAIERTGFDPDRVHLVEDDSERLWRPFTGGIGPFSRVFVPLSSFERYDDDVLETLLVLITQKTRFRYYRILTGWGAVGVAFALLFGGDFVSTTILGVGFLALLVAVPAAVWGGRRLVFRNDARAAETVGTDRLVDAFVAQDEQRGGDSPSTLALLLRMTPSIEERVANLGGDVSRLPSSDAGQAPTPGQGRQPQDAPRQARQQGTEHRGGRRNQHPPGAGQPAGGRPPSDPPGHPEGERQGGRRHGAAASRDAPGRQPRQGSPPRDPGDGQQRAAPPRDPQRRESPPPAEWESESRDEPSWGRREGDGRRRAPADDDRDEAQW